MKLLQQKRADQSEQVVEETFMEKYSHGLHCLLRHDENSVTAVTVWLSGLEVQLSALLLSHSFSLTTGRRLYCHKSSSVSKAWQMIRAPRTMDEERIKELQNQAQAGDEAKYAPCHAF